LYGCDLDEIMANRRKKPERVSTILREDYKEAPSPEKCFQEREIKKWPFTYHHLHSYKSPNGLKLQRHGKGSKILWARITCA